MVMHMIQGFAGKCKRQMADKARKYETFFIISELKLAKNKTLQNI